MDVSTGYFDDESVIRRVLRERALALSGPRALLMQAAHPLAVAGLLAHSESLEDPYVRLLIALPAGLARGSPDRDRPGRSRPRR